MNHLMTKPTKWSVHPSKTQSDQNYYLIRVFPEHSMGRLNGCPGWSESSLGTHAILLVLSWGSSNYSTQKPWDKMPWIIQIYTNHLHNDVSLLILSKRMLSVCSSCTQIYLPHFCCRYRRKNDNIFFSRKKLKNRRNLYYDKTQKNSDPQKLL